MTDEKKPLKYAVSTYVGKEYVKSFENEDGTVTKSYKYKFKESPEQQFGTNYWGYNTTKGAEEMVEGEKYTIGYVEGNNPKGDKPLKLARFFGKDDGRVRTESKPEEKKEPVSFDKELEEFDKDYSAEKIEGDCRETFMLTWFANKHEKEYDAVHAYCVKKYSS